MKNYGIDVAEGTSVTNITVPSGADFPSSPNNGEMFYKTSDNLFYGYANGSWVTITPPGGGYLSLGGGTLTGDLRVNASIGVNRDPRVAVDVGGDLLIQPTTAVDGYVKIRHGSSSVSTGLKADSSGVLTVFTNDSSVAFTVNSSAVTSFNNSPLVPSVSTSDLSTKAANTTFVKGMFGSSTTAGTADWNDVSNTQPGANGTLLTGSATNGPGGSAFFHPLTFEYSTKDGTGNLTQLAIGYNVGDIYHRYRYSSVWDSWIRILNSSNYTSYSPSLTGTNASGTWGISITGNAATSTVLQTARSITASGDASWTVSFDGSTNVTSGLTLANSGVSAGTYNNSATAITPLTIDVKGRITSTGAAVTITPAWSSITSTPTTLAGYGITDATSTSGTTYVGTTAVGLTRSSANQALTGILSVAMPGSTSGTITVTPVAVAGTNTITLPATTGTVITTGDTGTVTNTMLAGSIANAKLINSSVTIGSTNVPLGSTVTTIAGLTTVNGLTLTANATGFSIAGGTTSKTLTMSNTLTFSGTDSSSVNFAAGGTVAYTGGTLAQFAATTSAQLAGVISDETGSGALVFATSPTFDTSLLTSSSTFALLNTTATTINFAGAATSLNIGAGTGTTLINNNLSVVGNLTVNGTTTTVNSTVVSLDDPILTLGGDTAPGSDDNKDRGIEFRWHNGSVAKVGFFGFDDSTGKFTFIPDATNTSEVFSGTKGILDANIAWGDVTNTPTTLAGYGITDAQALDADLTAIAALSGTSGFLKKTAADTWTLDTNSYSLTSHTHNYILNGTSNVDIPSSGGSISFVTAGTQRASIDTSGNMILSGSSTHLQIESTTNVDGKIRFKNTLNEYTVGITGAATGDYLVYDVTNSRSLQSYSKSGNYHAFYTNNTERVRIDSSGRVGIGATPDTNGMLTVYQSAAVAASRIRVANGFANSQSIVELVNDARQYHIKIDGANQADDMFKVYDATAAADRLVIDSSGNVGIGTSTPSSPLHVVGTSTISNGTGVPFLNILGRNTDGLAQIQFRDNGNTVSNAKLTARTNAFAIEVNGTERVNIDSSGNVGIGSNDPQAKLHVVGAGAQARFDVATATDARHEYYRNGVREGYLSWDANLLSIAATQTSGDVRILTNSNERMRIFANGNVGIGATSPSAQLHVKSLGEIFRLETTAAAGSGNAYLTFYDTTSRKGYIGYAASINDHLTIANEKTGANIRFITESTEKVVITNVGNVLIGTPSSRAAGGVTPLLQVEGTTSTSTMSVTKNSNDATGPYLMINKSRGTAVGSNTIVQSGDILGTIMFNAADGTDIASGAASIVCRIDGTPALDDTPGRLVFFTTPAGSNTPTERMRIDSSGNVGIGGTPSGTYKLEVTGNSKVTGYSTIGLSILSTATLTTSATTADQVITAFGASTHRSAKFLIQVTSGSSYHVTELVVLHDGTTTYNNEYGTMFTGSSLATFNTDISGGSVRLLTTPTNAVTTYKVSMTLIEI